MSSTSKLSKTLLGILITAGVLLVGRFLMNTHFGVVFLAIGFFIIGFVHLFKSEGMIKKMLKGDTWTDTPLSRWRRKIMLSTEYLLMLKIGGVMAIAAGIFLIWLFIRGYTVR